MNALRLTGAILIVLGLAGFFTGGFSFTKETTQAKLGPLTGPLELRVYHGIFASGVDEIRSGGHVFKV